MTGRGPEAEGVRGVVTFRNRQSSVKLSGPLTGISPDCAQAAPGAVAALTPCQAG